MMRRFLRVPRLALLVLAGLTMSRRRIAGFGAALALLAVAAGAGASPGDLSPSFGTGGKVWTSISYPTSFAQAMALQQDGKIVLAGATYVGDDEQWALARYNQDG